MKSFDMKLIEIIGYVLFAIGEVLVLSYMELKSNNLVILGALIAILGMCCFLYYVLKEYINRLIMIHKTKKLLNKIGSNSLTLKANSIFYNKKRIIGMNFSDKTYFIYAIASIGYIVPNYNNLKDPLRVFFRKYVKYNNKIDLRARVILTLLEDL